jgi:uncharacterized protein (TIGR02246 family)
MKLTVLCAVFLLVILSVLPRPAANADSGASDPRPNAQDLIDIDKRWGAAITSQEVKVVEGLLADQYMGITTSGEVMQKGDELKQISENRLANHKYEADSYEVRFLDSKTAIMIHRGVYKITEAGREATEVHRSLHIFTNDNGTWRIAASSQTPSTR